LLDVAVVEVDDGVAVWEHLSLHTVVEDYLFLSVLIHSLDLPIVAYILVDNLHVAWSLVVVLIREFHVELLGIFVCMDDLRLVSLLSSVLFPLFSL